MVMLCAVVVIARLFERSEAIQRSAFHVPYLVPIKTVVGIPSQTLHRCALRGET